jgi:hypothetical protein
MDHGTAKEPESRLGTLSHGAWWRLQLTLPTRSVLSVAHLGTTQQYRVGQEALDDAVVRDPEEGIGQSLVPLNHQRCAFSSRGTYPVEESACSTLDGTAVEMDDSTRPCHRDIPLVDKSRMCSIVVERNRTASAPESTRVTLRPPFVLSIKDLEGSTVLEPAHNR